MTMLVHRSPLADAEPFDLAALKVFVRMDAPDVDAELVNMARTAAAEVEHVGQLALLTQTIRVELFDPPAGAGLYLPIGPASEDPVPSVTADGVAVTGFDFVGGLKPYLRWHESVATNWQRLTIEYQAGFGADAGDIPPDLAQAVLDQAAMHFDGRSPMDSRNLTSSPHMSRIVARYRGVRL